MPENKLVFSNPSKPSYFPRHSDHDNDRSTFLKIATLVGRYLFLESKSVCKFLKAKVSIISADILFKNKFAKPDINMVYNVH